MKLLHRICGIIYLFGFGIDVQALQSTDRPAAHRSELHTVFFDTTLRKDCISFMQHVLQHQKPQQFFDAIDRISEQEQLVDKNVSDECWYKKLSSLKQSDYILPLPYDALRALANQKKILGSQATSLLKKDTPYNNCVEIGTPGTYASLLKTTLPITGSICVVNDKQQWSDAVQSFSYKPLNGFVAYDNFVPLNEYEPITEESIASSTVDLVVCFIGLHHVPVEKLDAFLSSIARILRPGGVFLLREHDAATPEIMALTHAAHSIFNLYLAKATLSDEINEYRNFNDMSYWTTLLEAHGFDCGDTRLLQEGDPTKNTLFACTKRARNIQEQTEIVTHELHKNADYVRDDIQGILTTPEWHNVHTSEAYSEFINHTPFYEFPYFKSIKSFWHIFAQSFLLARQKKGTWATLTSDYTQMNLFIGAMSTLEYGAKGIVSLPLKWMFSGKAATTINLLVKDRQGEAAQLGNSMKVIKQHPDTDLILLEVPRYKEFLNCMQVLADTNIELIEVAGQKEIQLTVAYNHRQQLDDCLALPGCSYQYDWQVPTRSLTHAALIVPVASLKIVLKKLAQRTVDIVYIHDF